jgi:hypothetical protein
VSAGAEYGEDHALTFTSMLLRVTEDEARVTTGKPSDDWHAPVSRVAKIAKSGFAWLVR